MGALLTRLYGIDQNTPYGFKFSGITLWLLAADAGVQRVIDDFNPNCPRWCRLRVFKMPTLTPSTRLVHAGSRTARSNTACGWTSRTREDALHDSAMRSRAAGQ